MKTAIKITGVMLGVLALIAACTNPVPPEETTTTTEATTTTTEVVTTTTTTEAPTTTTTTPGGECTPNESSGCVEGNSSGEYFKESFNGSPASPTSILNAFPRWHTAYAMESTGGGWEFNPESMEAQHTTACGPPPATHTIQNPVDSVYQCKDHVMTALNPRSSGTANGVISLTPNHMVDLSKGSASVKIDVSTLSPSAGDWWEIWITPPEDALVAPSDHWFHQTGVPERSLHFKVFDSGPTIKRWQGKAINNYQFAGGRQNTWEGVRIDSTVSKSDTRRDTYEVRIEGNTVKMLVEETATGELKQVDQFDFPAGLLGDKAVVQFVHSNYEPEKNGKVGCGSVCPDSTVPATWHWDNAEIYPAIEYRQVKANPIMVSGLSSSNEVTFAEPASGNMDLVFIAHTVGNSPQVSFDDGNTWVNAYAVRPNNDPPNAGWGGSPDTMTYRIDVPDGQTSVRLRGNNPWNMTWTAYGFYLVDY